MSRKKATSFSCYSKRMLAVMVLLLGGLTAHATQVTEDFENVAIVDDNGNEPTSSLISCAGLSNGWKIIGGYIYYSDNGDYQLVNKAGSGWLYSDRYLSSSSTSMNNAYVFIPVKVIGEVQFFAKSNLDERSKKTSKIMFFEATADGVVTDNMLYSYEPAKASNWLPRSFNIEGEEGKYIAINMVYADIDDITFNTADGTSVAPLLSISTGSIDFGTIQVATTKTVVIKSNVTTAVTLTLSGEGAEAFTIKDAPTILTANTPTNVTIEFKGTTAATHTAKLDIATSEQEKTVILTGTWEEAPADIQPTDWKGEDFNTYHEGDEMPIGWKAEGWGIGEPFLLDTPAVITTSGGTLTTPVFEAASNQSLQFYFSKTAIGWLSYGSKMEISWSADKEQWHVLATYDKTESDGTKTIALPATGSCYVRFVVNDRTYLDDFEVIGGDTTGIEEMKRQKAEGRSEAYNLGGQRISNSRVKNIYIQHGKKVYGRIGY